MEVLWHFDEGLMVVEYDDDFVFSIFPHLCTGWHFFPVFADFEEPCIFEVCALHFREQLYDFGVHFFVIGDNVETC